MAKKKATGSLIDTAKYDYQRVSIRDKNGKVRHSAINGDAISKALLVHTAEGGTINGVIRDNGLTAKFKDKGGNAGTLRMSVGVALRAIVRSGEAVKIGKVTVKSLKQAVELPKVEKAAAKKSSKKKAGKPKAKRTPRARKTPATEAPAQEAAAQ